MLSPLHQALVGRGGPVSNDLDAECYDTCYVRCYGYRGRIFSQIGCAAKHSLLDYHSQRGGGHYSQAHAAEVITVKLMLWLHQSPLIVLILILNAFITFQFLRYGDIALSEGRESKAHIMEITMPREIPTMFGVALRLAMMAVGGMLVAYFIVGRGIFSEFGVIMIGVLMLPVLIVVLCRRWRLRETITKKGTSPSS
jgi:hypothetical protein